MREGVRMMGRGGGNLEERAASCELRDALGTMMINDGHDNNTHL